MVFKVLASLMVLLFVLAAGVQYNDPDALFWIALYGVMAALSIAAMLGRNVRLIALPLSLAIASYVIYLSPRFADTSFQAFASVGMSSVVEEEVRELWGLVVCLLWTIFLLARTFMRHPAREHQVQPTDSQARR